MFAVTNQRVLILERRGLFEKSVRQASFREINNVSYKQKGMMETLFNYGNIELSLKGQSEPFILEKIKSPNLVYQVIAEEQRHFSQSKPVPSESIEAKQPKEDLTGDQAIRQMIKLYGIERVEKNLREFKDGQSVTMKVKGVADEDDRRIVDRGV